MTELPLCPRCSFFVRRHPELLRDYIRRPYITRGPRGGRFFMQECCHHSRLPGPFAEPQEIATAWQAIARDLEHDLPDEKRADLAAYESRLEQFEARCHAGQNPR